MAEVNFLKVRHTTKTNSFQVGEDSNAVTVQGGKISSKYLSTKIHKTELLQSKKHISEEIHSQEIHSQEMTTVTHVLTPLEADPPIMANGMMWTRSNDGKLYVWLDGHKQRVKLEDV